MKQYLYLAQSENGHVKYPPCKHAIHIRYKHFMWKFSPEGLKVFQKYVSYLNTPTGFAQNEEEPGLAVIMLEKHCFMGLFAKNEIEELASLLETSTVELVRQELELQYQKVMS